VCSLAVAIVLPPLGVFLAVVSALATKAAAARQNDYVGKTTMAPGHGKLINFMCCARRAGRQQGLAHQHFADAVGLYTRYAFFDSRMLVGEASAPDHGVRYVLIGAPVPWRDHPCYLHHCQHAQGRPRNLSINVGRGGVDVRGVVRRFISA